MVMILKRTLAFFAAIIFFALAISFVAFNMNYFDPLDLAIRLLALNGFLALSIAAILTPFIKEVTLFFKKSFLNIHHYFAVAGLLLITLHPVANSYSSLKPRFSCCPTLGPSTFSCSTEPAWR
jgi:hypothetical protein